MTELDRILNMSAFSSLRVFVWLVPSAWNASSPHILSCMAACHVTSGTSSRATTSLLPRAPRQNPYVLLWASITSCPIAPLWHTPCCIMFLCGVPPTVSLWSRELILVFMFPLSPNTVCQLHKTFLQMIVELVTLHVLKNTAVITPYFSITYL